MTDDTRHRWAEAVIDLAAVDHNLRLLTRAVAPAAVWAVVKADAYGHGAVPVATVALRAGAQGLCVALTDEGLHLRRHGITAPILVLSPQPPHDVDRAVAAGLTLTVHSVEQVHWVADGARRHAQEHVPVHVKVDTGMHRVGVTPREAHHVVRAIVEHAPLLSWDGVFSHLACADDPDHDLTPRQIERFTELVARLEADGLAGARRHLANSAGALAWPSAAHDLVRAGIALYGIEPGPGVAEHCGDLRRVMTLRARVSMVKTVPAGAGVSYGWRDVLERDTVVATVPLGYADGVPRRLSTTGGEVLIAGVRRRILGVITMDQFMVDCGDDDVAVGDEVVLLGRQGTESIRAEDWAERLGTIPYEIVCGISARVPRRWTNTGQ
jgi:alanine racemase